MKICQVDEDLVKIGQKHPTYCMKSWVGYVLVFLATLNLHKSTSSGEVLSGSWDSRGCKNMRTRHCYLTRTLLLVFLSTPRNSKRSVPFKSWTKFLYLLYMLGTAVAQWLRCFCTNRKVAGSIPDGVIGIFHWHNPSDRTMALGSTQPLTEMSTRIISCG
jgi:hypothetical protein